MSKNTKILLLSLAALFLFMGIKSYQYSIPYSELTDIQTIKGTIYKLHCPQNGAAALSFADSNLTYNLTVKFRTDYCHDDNSQVLLGKKVTMKAVQVSGDYYQVYQIEEKDKIILSPEDVESDQRFSTLGLFLLVFLILTLVAYKSRSTVKNKLSKIAS